MGTWAVGSFGNDAAGDWVIDLADNPNYSFLRDTLQNTIDIPDDSETNACAIAAAEVLCIIEGRVPADYEEVAHNLRIPVSLLQQQPMPAGLKPLAIIALNTILSGSELKEVWENDEEWIREVQRLLDRLEE